MKAGAKMTFQIDEHTTEGWRLVVSKKGYDWWDSNIRRPTIGWIQNSHCSYLESRRVPEKNLREILEKAREIISLSFPVAVHDFRWCNFGHRIWHHCSSTNATWAVPLYYYQTISQSVWSSGTGCYDKYVFYRNQNSISSAVSIFTKDVIAGRKYLAVFDVWINPCFCTKDYVWVCAVDTIEYVTISSDADAANLQQDLDKLAEWKSKRLMKFHPEKCNVLTISKKRSPSKYNYTLHGHILEHDTSAKYLGCTISSDLKWGKHISTICSKANNTISFLKRNINISNKSIKEKAYVSLVRPTLEYAGSVWDPYQQNDIHRLEMVQFDDSGQLSTKIYDKRDDFNFKIINFPNMCSNIPASPAYGVYISQLIRYARASSNYSDFLKRHLHLRNRLLDQGYKKIRLIRSLKKFIFRYQYLVEIYSVSAEKIISDAFSYSENV